MCIIKLTLKYCADCYGTTLAGLTIFVTLVNFFKLKYLQIFFLNIYLFIWLCGVLVAAGSLLSCGSPAP